MPIGLSGSTPSTTAGDQTAQLILIENRVQSLLLAQAAWPSQPLDSLPSMRNDEAFALGTPPLPIPGIV